MRDVNERFKEHLRDVNKYPNFKLYQAMKNGIEHLYILLVEEVNVDDVQELRKRECQYIKLIPGGLNENVAGRDFKQYQIDIEGIIIESIGHIIIEH